MGAAGSGAAYFPGCGGGMFQKGANTSRRVRMRLTNACDVMVIPYNACDGMVQQQIKA